jgi:hypothetical protein
MISKFIRSQWESEELEGVDDERRITSGVSGRRRRSRPTSLAGGLGNHPGVETI